MSRFRLRWKIFIFLLGFCTLLLLILWLFETVFLNDMYKQIRKGELQNAIERVTENVNANSDNLNEIIMSIAEEYDIRVSPTKQYKFEESLLRPEQSGKNKRMPEEMTETRDFTLQDGSVLSLTFHAVITPVNATVNTLRYQLCIITAIMLILSIALAIILAARVSKPIEEINKSAKLLAKGDYQAQFCSKGFLEITELSGTLNTAATELAKVEGFRQELLANISHDLRTPLSLIYSYAEVMHDFPDEITTDQTQVIMDEAKRLAALVNDVLDISKLEAGMLEINPANFNLTRCIRDTTERMEKFTQKEGYEITFNYDEEVSVFADEVKIMQAYYNLLINAINYTGDDKRIFVNQIVQEGTVTIQVRDTGDGIQEENLPYIWDRYYKEKHKRAVTGTGLGLSIVRKIIELHGGSYGAKTQGGSVFWFELKLDKALSLESHV